MVNSVVASMEPDLKKDERARPYLFFKDSWCGIAQTDLGSAGDALVAHLNGDDRIGGRLRRSHVAGSCTLVSIVHKVRKKPDIPRQYLPLLGNV